MKNRFKRIAIVLSLALIVGSFAACGKSEEPSQTSGATSSQASGSEASKPAGYEHAVVSILLPEYNKAIGNWDKRKEEPFWSQNKNPWKGYQELLDKYNLEVDLQFVPTEQYQTVLQTRMAAANNLPDIVHAHALDTATMLSFAKQGIIQPISDLVDKYSNGNVKRAMDEVAPYLRGVITASDGKYYWLSNAKTNKYYSSANPEGEIMPIGLTMQMRKDWLDKLGIAAPTTTAEFMAAVKKMRDVDVNGNGKKDEIVAANVQIFGNGISQWFGLGDQLATIDVVNQKVVSPWYQEGLKEYILYMQELYKAGLLEPSLNSWEMGLQLKAENRVIASHEYGMAGWIENEVTGVKDVEFIPLQTLDNGIDGVMSASSGEPTELVYRRYAVTKACKNQEAAVRFFDMAYSKEMEDLQAGQEGRNYYVQDGIKLSYNETQMKEKGVDVTPFMSEWFPSAETFGSINGQLTGTTELKKNYQIGFMDRLRDGKILWYPNIEWPYLAVPTDEEIEKTNEINTNLDTLNQELLTKLCLGQYTVDKLDTYIAQLEKLGLKDLIAIKQAQLDRHNGTK